MGSGLVPLVGHSQQLVLGAQQILVDAPGGICNCDAHFDPSDPRSVYLATSTVIGPTSGGVYHSSDGGKSWTWAGKGLPPDRKVFCDTIWWGGRELAMGPDGTLLAISASCNSVYRFDRAGDTWAAVNLQHIGSLYSIVADLLTPGRFYVCVVGNEARPGDAGGGLFRTDDFGASWEKILAGSVHAVASDRGVKNRVVASNTDGVFLSANGGNTWTALEKLPNRWASNCLAFAGNRILAGSGGNGAFWIDLSGLTPAPIAQSSFAGERHPRAGFGAPAETSFSLQTKEVRGNGALPPTRAGSVRSLGTLPDFWRGSAAVPGYMSQRRESGIARMRGSLVGSVLDPL